MAIVSSPQDFNEDQLFVDLEPRRHTRAGTRTGTGPT